ncbi:unnamed protein product [Lathyrus sativus]|nr:unnamed protein product [Lathyrus sativus]
MERLPLINLIMTLFNIPLLWKECLSSAFRTALACTIVASVTLYGPTSVTTFITFPAFSYVVVILIIINDATLGDALRGCWLGLYATIQSLGPAMLSLWAMGPNRFSKGTASVAVALAAFVVVLPSDKSTHLIAKRISLGQIVLVYVLAYSNGVHVDAFVHPLHLAASTFLGVIACVVALLLPFPRFACSQVNKNYKLLTNNISKRLKLLVKIIKEEKNISAFGLISRAKFLTIKRTKIFSTILRYLDGMKWERLPINFFKPHYNNLGERLQEVDTSLIGMELALSCTKSFPINILNQDLTHGLDTLEEHVNLTIKNAKHTFLGSGSLTVPETNSKNITHFLQSLYTIPTTQQELPIFFFLFCAKLLHMKPSTQGPTSSQAQPIKKKENQYEANDKWAYWATALKNTNLLPAIKYSFSLGLSVYMGLLYSKESGFWSGLPVAVSYVSGREATFRAANVKAQGTVIGTVYGVLGCFVFNRLLSIRFLSLLPWFIFTSFLQRSRMYGPAGGISAIIGAVLILGRKNIGPPSEFAIERIIETFIGLSCSIFVDLLFWPKRASTCAKFELSKCLSILIDSIETLSLVDKTDLQLKENQRKLKMQVNELKKFVIEAEAEPNFWFLPFHSGCYNRLLGSLSKLVDVLHFGALALKSLQQEFQRSDNNSMNEEVNMLQTKLVHVKEVMCCSIKGLEEISKMKSFKFVEKEKKNMSWDIEMGKSKVDSAWLSSLGEDGTREIVESFLQKSRDVVDNLYSDEGENEVKSEVVLSLSVVGFCLSVCMQGTIEIEEAMRELVQWENSSSNI